MGKKLLFVLFVCLILTGCKFLPFGEEDKTSPYKGKINGLIMEFEDGKPPKSAFVNDEVIVSLLVTNTGEYEVEDFRAEFVGVVGTENFKKTSEGVSGISLDAIDFFGQSNTEKVEVGSFVYEKEMIAKTYEPLIEVEVCYDYGTNIVSDSFYVGKEESYISRGKVSSSDNSNGPVQITELDEEIYGDKLAFNFVVKHVGGGEIVDDCEADNKFEDDVVEVEILSPVGIKCSLLGSGSNAGEIYLVKGAKRIDCILDIHQDVGYKDRFEAKLKYHYKDKLSKKITIKKRIYG